MPDSMPDPMPDVIPDDSTPDDERFFTMKGRRWRRTDPSIPDDLGQQLTKELMSARRAVKAAKASGSEADMQAARLRVQDAKVALGERGHPWWEEPTYKSHGERIAAAIRCLLRRREGAKTMCPSEAARVVGGPDWRTLMSRTRDVAWQLETAGVLVVTQHGKRVDRSARGPIRLRASDSP